VQRLHPLRAVGQQGTPGTGNGEERAGHTFIAQEIEQLVEERDITRARVVIREDKWHPGR
jgi:hypothetical protein